MITICWRALNSPTMALLSACRTAARILGIFVRLPFSTIATGWVNSSIIIVAIFFDPVGRPLGSSKQVDAQCWVSPIHTEFSHRQEGRLAAYGKRLRVLLADRSRWRSLYPGGCSSETPGT